MCRQEIERYVLSHHLNNVNLLILESLSLFFRFYSNFGNLVLEIFLLKILNFLHFGNFHLF